MVYGTTNKNLIDVNNPSQIIDKIAFKEIKDSIAISIPKLYLEKHNNCALTFIDYFGNESQATLLKANNQNKKPKPTKMKTENTPWYWIPLLNFASGFPYVIIISVSVLMYKNLGISNEDIGLYTSLLYLPWVIKPLWSPFIDLHGTKRKWFLSMQLFISIAFLIVGFVIPTSQFFMMSLAIFWVAAFASASNDVASDGFYLLALTKDQQSFFLEFEALFTELQC